MNESMLLELLRGSSLRAQGTRHLITQDAAIRSGSSLRAQGTRRTPVGQLNQLIAGSSLRAQGTHIASFSRMNMPFSVRGSSLRAQGTLILLE